MIAIRRATPEDASTVHGLLRELAEHQDGASAVTVSVPGLERMPTRPEITYLIVERNSQAIGYVSWLERVSFWSGEDYLHLDDLYVCGAEGGCGVGEQLMDAVAEAAKGKLIRWEVAETNEAAQRFSTRLGATLVSRKIGHWQPR